MLIGDIEAVLGWSSKANSSCSCLPVLANSVSIVFNGSTTPRIGKPNSSVCVALDQPATEGFASSAAIGSAAILGWCISSSAWKSEGRSSNCLTFAPLAKRLSVPGRSRQVPARCGDPALRLCDLRSSCAPLNVAVRNAAWPYGLLPILRKSGSDRASDMGYLRAGRNKGQIQPWR